jgi:hypothetical protein
MKVQCWKCRTVFAVRETGFRRCPNCHSDWIDENPVLSPEEMKPEGDQSEPEPTPWELRKRVGFVAGVRHTVVSIARNPFQFFERMQTDSDNGMVAWFVLVMIIPYTAALLVTRWMDSPGDLDATVSRFNREPNTPVFMKPMAGLLHYYFTGPGFAAFLVGSLVWRSVLTVAWAGAAYAFLVYFKFPQRGWSATLKVFAYASTAGLLNLVPYVGLDVTMLGVVVLAIIGVAKVHKTDLAQAIGAVLVPAVIPGLGFCCFSAWWGALWSVAAARPPS